MSDCNTVVSEEKSGFGICILVHLIVKQIILNIIIRMILIKNNKNQVKVIELHFVFIEISALVVFYDLFDLVQKIYLKTLLIIIFVIDKPINLVINVQVIRQLINIYHIHMKHVKEVTKTDLNFVLEGIYEQIFYFNFKVIVLIYLKEHYDLVDVVVVMGFNIVHYIENEVLKVDYIFDFIICIIKNNF